MSSRKISVSLLRCIFYSTHMKWFCYHTFSAKIFIRIQCVGPVLFASRLNIKSFCLWMRTNLFERSEVAHINDKKSFSSSNCWELHARFLHLQHAISSRQDYNINRSGHPSECIIAKLCQHCCEEKNVTEWHECHIFSKITNSTTVSYRAVQSQIY